jgi:hypothetical protein
LPEAFLSRSFKLKNAAKKHPVLTLQDRVKDLLIELDEALDDLAAERKALTAKCGPEGEGAAIPQSTFRRIMEARGHGDCLCRSYLAAKQEDQ